MKNRKLILIVSLVLAMTMSLGGTLAYLTDTDSDVNTMVLGNVKIEQHEYERIPDDKNEYGYETYNEAERDGSPLGYKLQTYTQDKPLLPVVGKVEGWKEEPQVYFAQLPDKSNLGAMPVLEGLNNVQDKFVFVENTGNTNAYVRTYVAFEAGSCDATKWSDLVMSSAHKAWKKNDIGIVNINGNNYYVIEYVYDGNFYKEDGTVEAETNAKHPGGVVPAGDFTYCNLAQVYLKSKATNEDLIDLDGNANGTYDIIVLSQAVQADGFGDAKTALTAGFGAATATNEEDTTKTNVQVWLEAAGASLPAVKMVKDAAELKDAIAAGGEETIVLTADIAVDADTAITIASGKEVTLNLHGHEIAATANKTGNQELFLVKGNMTVKNGSLKFTAENNQGWNAMATLFDVTAGGVLNMDCVTANVSGTDMNFVVHLNNWGEATLNMNDCDITTTYVGVRAFNSGHDMNNVTIKNTEFKGGRAFWVHNYTAEGKDDSTLNLSIYNNGNTSDHEKPVRFGFSNSVYYDLNGTEIQ